MAPKIHTLKKLPAKFWKDYKWALEHYPKLRERYPDMWVAIADKKVIAFGKDLDEREESIFREIGRPPITLFVERQENLLVFHRGLAPLALALSGLAVQPTDILSASPLRALNRINIALYTFLCYIKEIIHS